MLNNKSLLITGGTGSFGRAFVRACLQRFPAIKRLVIYSRDELKQFEMMQEYGRNELNVMRFFLGDIRDRDRLKRALQGIDVVIHAAALKQVPAAEYNPFEFIKTNVLGAQNLVETCIGSGVRHVVALSTDKAAAPINLYGATKLCSDKLFTAANNMRGNNDIRFSVVRYGNVMGSRGSVIPFFMNLRSTNVLPITDVNMTRFNICLDDGVRMVFWAIENSLGGEIFVPKIPSYKIIDLAKAIAPQAELRIVGIRPGEKIHEEMITESDSFNTVDIGEYYVILPSLTPVTKQEYCAIRNGKEVKIGFSYTSGNNPDFLNIEDLRKLMRSNLGLEV